MWNMGHSVSQTHIKMKVPHYPTDYDLKPNIYFFSVFNYGTLTQARICDSSTQNRMSWLVFFKNVFARGSGYNLPRKVTRLWLLASKDVHFIIFSQGILLCKTRKHNRSVLCGVIWKLRVTLWANMTGRVI